MKNLRKAEQSMRNLRALLNAPTAFQVFFTFSL